MFHHCSQWLGTTTLAIKKLKACPCRKILTAISETSPALYVFIQVNYKHFKILANAHNLFRGNQRACEHRAVWLAIPNLADISLETKRVIKQQVSFVSVYALKKTIQPTVTKQINSAPAGEIWFLALLKM
jgi:hypothetical protein